MVNRQRHDTIKLTKKLIEILTRITIGFTLEKEKLCNNVLDPEEPFSGFFMRNPGKFFFALGKFFRILSNSWNLQQVF